MGGMNRYAAILAYSTSYISGLTYDMKRMYEREI